MLRRIEKEVRLKLKASNESKFEYLNENSHWSVICIFATPSNGAFKLQFTRIISRFRNSQQRSLDGPHLTLKTRTNPWSSHGARIHMNCMGLKRMPSQLDFLVSWTTKHFYFLERVLSLNWAGWYPTSAFPKVFFAIAKQFCSMSVPGFCGHCDFNWGYIDQKD